MDHTTNTTDIVFAGQITGALIAFALGFMNQQSGLVYETDTDVAIPLRISPIIRLLDAINIISHFVKSFYYERSLERAMGALLGWRFSVQHHAVLRVRPHLLKIVVDKLLPRVYPSAAMLYTSINIFGSEASVLTKVIAAACLFSFIVPEFFVVWPAMFVSIREPDEEEQ
ncbi:hypothetical protein K4K48_001942 [Colletotrichum sp. SAR 10_66]|nr:hypothetical protein K4K48_001942 [Colletotrichum sp. SAR 10_66]